MRLLVALDLSEHSKAALAEVRRIPWPSGTTVTLLTVVRSDVYAFTDLHAPTMGPIESRTAEDVQQARMRLAEQAGALGTLPVELRVERGDARMAICDVAREIGADWVVVGSHGRSGLPKLVLGSVASHVATHAPCSVLVVKRRSDGTHPGEGGRKP